MGSNRSPESKALRLAMLYVVSAVMCVWGVLHVVVDRGSDGADLAGRSRWLDEPLQAPPDSPRSEPVEASEPPTVGAREGSPAGGHGVPAPGRRTERSERLDLEVPTHALLVDERALRRSFGELELLDEARAARASALGASAPSEEEGRAAIDSGGAALRDSLLTARAHLLSRGEAVSRVERELRFVEETD